MNVKYVIVILFIVVIVLGAYLFAWFPSWGDPLANSTATITTDQGAPVQITDLSKEEDTAPDINSYVGRIVEIWWSDGNPEIIVAFGSVRITGPLGNTETYQLSRVSQATDPKFGDWHTYPTPSSTWTVPSYSGVYKFTFEMLTREGDSLSDTFYAEV